MSLATHYFVTTFLDRSSGDENMRFFKFSFGVCQLSYELFSNLKTGKLNPSFSFAYCPVAPAHLAIKLRRK